MFVSDAKNGEVSSQWIHATFNAFPIAMELVESWCSACNHTVIMINCHLWLWVGNSSALHARCGGELVGDVASKYCAAIASSCTTCTYGRSGCRRGGRRSRCRTLVSMLETHTLSDVLYSHPWLHW